MKNKNISQRISKHAKRNRHALIVALINAVALFLLCYFIDNLPYSFVGDANVGQRIEQIKQLFNSADESVPSDLLLINVAYDRELVSVDDEFGMPKGNIDITNRSNLLELLGNLRKSNYKYIILDVSFTDGYHTEVDSTLFGLISSMDNIVVAKSETTRLADGIFAGKARYSDYSTHISESNFVKYEFVRNGEPTLPYQVYLDLHGNSISHFCGFYFFKGRLANKSVVLRHPIKLWNKFQTNQGVGDFAKLQYYNLGSDILDIELDISAIANDKIVVIGDFTEDDIHETYLGKIAGPVINLNAYYALVNDNLTIPYSEIVFILLLYTVISYLIIKRIPVAAAIPYIKNIRSRFIQFVISFIGISTLLITISILLYVLFGLDMNIFVPSIYFTCLITLMKYKVHNVK